MQQLLTFNINTLRVLSINIDRVGYTYLGEGIGFGIGCILAFLKGVVRRTQDLFPGVGRHRHDFKGVRCQRKDFLGVEASMRTPTFPPPLKIVRITMQIHKEKKNEQKGYYLKKDKC